jgi:hypothetical protein
MVSAARAPVSLCLKQADGGLAAMKSVERACITVLSVVVGAVLAVLSAGPAAAVAGPTLDLAAPLRPAANFSSAASAGMGVQNLITCGITVDNPHKSTHVPGTVNVVSRVICSAPISEINGIVGLYRNAVLISYSTGQNFGSAALTMNTATPCVSGRYDALGVADIYAPPGYYPPVARISARSTVVNITC